MVSWQSCILNLIIQAVQYGDKEIVKQWLDYYKHQPYHTPHDHDQHGLTPIHYAAKFNQLAIMEILCKRGSAGSYNLVHTY